MANIFDNPWGADKSIWFNEEKDKWFGESGLVNESLIKNEQNKEGNGEVAPGGYIKYKSAGGGIIFLPTSSDVFFFTSDNPRLKNKNIKTNALKNEVQKFEINKINYTAGFSKETGAFIKYRNSNNEEYVSPKGLISTGVVSKSSWGETASLYPTKEGKNDSGLYLPKNWDYAMSLRILEMRAAIERVSKRNSHLRKASPSKGNIDKTISIWHMIDNFPTVDTEISSNSDVKYFFISPNKNAKHSGLNYETHDVKVVKRYGPFYNIGGGDVPKGPVYVLFYYALPKEKE